MPQLPGSMRSLWGAADNSGAVPLHAAIVQERHEIMPTPIDGLLRIDLEVRRRDAPDTPAASDEPAASAAPAASDPAGAVEARTAAGQGPL